MSVTDPAVELTICAIDRELRRHFGKPRAVRVVALVAGGSYLFSATRTFPGNDRSLAPQLIGPFSSGTSNDNTDRFLSFCISNHLRICGTWFRRPDIHRHSWYSNDGHTAKEIDHILVNTRWERYPAVPSVSKL